MFFLIAILTDDRLSNDFNTIYNICDSEKIGFIPDWLYWFVADLLIGLITSFQHRFVCNLLHRFRIYMWFIYVILGFNERRIYKRLFKLICYRFMISSFACHFHHIFVIYCTDSFKSFFLGYKNEILFFDLFLIFISLLGTLDKDRLNK